MAFGLDGFVSSLYLSVEIGSLYALMAVGFTLTMGVTKIPNLAHAEYVTIGAYICMYMTRFMGSGLAEALVVSFLATSATAWLSYRLLFRPMIARGSSSFILMIGSFALDLILRYSLYMVAAPNNWLGVPTGVGISVVTKFGFLYITNIFVWAVPTAIALMFLLRLFMQRTRAGKTMRAISDNRQLAQAIGVDPERVYNLTFIISGGLAGIAGGFYVVFTLAHPELGYQAMVDIFAASSIGAYLSLPATIVGGFIVGLAENAGINVLNQLFGVSFTFKPLMPILIIVLVLIIRPTGLSDISFSRMKSEIKMALGRLRT
ncbi:MAG TPA: branched-chain amino acid ABC transporter permease [Nitrososphaerales archaeon]|nr:branched-chain amino acid ABC transporter permease [Nitrososphaerales archaeon]